VRTIASTIVCRPRVFGQLGRRVVRRYRRLIDVQRLEQVIEAAGEVLPQHLAIVQASFA